MTDPVCAHCGAVASFARVVQLKDGKYEYACDGCAIMEARGTHRR